jgi:hypothetical protein
MKRIIVLAILALTASAASAQVAPRNWQRPDRVERRDVDGNWGTRYGDRYWRDRYNARDDGRWKRDFRGRWVTLADGFSANTNRQFVTLRGGAGTFRHLRIEAQRGRPVILKVAIEDTRGNTQVVDVNERLYPGEGEVITLNQSAPINRIIVYTDARVGGSYSVFGG